MRRKGHSLDYDQMITHFNITLSFDEGDGHLLETHQTFPVDIDMLKATVRVAVEIADKKFGAGISISGAVTLTVGQDDTMIETAFNYGASLLSEKIREVTPQINDIYDQLRQR